MEHLNTKSSNSNVCLFFTIIEVTLLIMTISKLIIYNYEVIYKILSELKKDLKLNLELINLTSKIKLDNYLKENPTELILVEKKINYSNLILIDNTPIKILKLIEKINIEILKKNFSTKSNVFIGKFSLDLNSREISYNKIKISLTEQEVKILTYLSNSTQAVKIEQLQKDIWRYASSLETHTVETHIHRLRKKILKNFKEDSLILSSKDGYLINKF